MSIKNKKLWAATARSADLETLRAFIENIQVREMYRDREDPIVNFPGWLIDIHRAICVKQDEAFNHIKEVEKND